MPLGKMQRSLEKMPMPLVMVRRQTQPTRMPLDMAHIQQV